MANADSRVRVTSRSIVKASGAGFTASPRVVALSNLDLLPQSCPVSLLCAYRKPSAAGFRDVVAAFQAKLPSLLDYFLPLTGRIVAADPPSGRRPEVHCDNQGAELVVGEVGVAMASLDYGDLDGSLARIGVPVQYAADVALSVQLVSFACGGFAVAWGSNHLLVDGHSLCIIASAWSQLARSGTITASGAPNHDRSVFRPRAAPSYGCSAARAFAPLDSEHLVNALTCNGALVRRIYYLEARDLATLRAAAGATRLEALSAYLWQVLAGVVGASDERCRMGLWVDGRYEAAGMRNYVGNVLTYAVAEASVETIQRQPLPDTASTVRELIRSAATEEHFQELIDWVEDKAEVAARYVEAANVGLGSPVLAVTSFVSHSPDTDFGFGHAALALPTADSCKRLCSGFVRITSLPAGGDDWILGMYVWPRLAAVLDDNKMFKTLTAEYLGLNQYSRL